MNATVERIGELMERGGVGGDDPARRGRVDCSSR